MLVNVYDFDKTIYAGDSSIDFFVHCLKKYPSILKRIPKFLFMFLKYKSGRCSEEKMKESFFSFVMDIPDINHEIVIFWEKNINKIKKWYLMQRNDSDIIISASPYFLLEPVATQISFRLIASNIDKSSALFDGKNCKHVEKVVQFKKKYPSLIINNFYSDSDVDQPLAESAINAFKVKDEKIRVWRI